jgi:hypothetical protein
MVNAISASMPRSPSRTVAKISHPPQTLQIVPRLTYTSGRDPTRST